MQHGVQNYYEYIAVAIFSHTLNKETANYNIFSESRKIYKWSRNKTNIEYLSDGNSNVH